MTLDAAETTAGAIAAEHGNRPDALIEILHKMQATLGHVPDAAVPTLDKLLVRLEPMAILWRLHRRNAP